VALLFSEGYFLIGLLVIYAGNWKKDIKKPHAEGRAAKLRIPLGEV